MEVPREDFALFAEVTRIPKPAVEVGPRIFASEARLSTTGSSLPAVEVDPAPMALHPPFRPILTEAKVASRLITRVGFAARLGKLAATVQRRGNMVAGQRPLQVVLMEQMVVVLVETWESAA